MSRFEKGNNYSTGRQRGARNKSTLWLDEIGRESTEKVIGAVLGEAEKGNMYAAAIMLARTWPRRRGRPVPLALPPVETTAGVLGAQAAVIAAMAKGEISPEEAASVANVLDSQRRAIETNDLARRVDELEAEARKAGGL